MRNPTKKYETQENDSAGFDQATVLPVNLSILPSLVSDLVTLNRQQSGDCALQLSSSLYGPPIRASPSQLGSITCGNKVNSACNYGKTAGRGLAQRTGVNAIPVLAWPAALIF